MGIRPRKPIEKDLRFDKINEEIQPLIKEYHKLIDKVTNLCMPVTEPIINSGVDDENLYTYYFKALLLCLQSHDPSEINFTSYLRTKVTWLIKDEMRKKKKRDALFKRNLAKISEETGIRDDYKKFDLDEVKFLQEEYDEERATKATKKESENGQTD